MTDDTYIDDLNQIQRGQNDLLKEIEQIKEKHKGDNRRDIEQIQSNSLRLVLEIDEIKKRVENSKTNLATT